MPFYSEDFLLSLPSSDCKWSWPRHQQSHVLQRLSFLSENWWMESWESMTLWRWPSGTEFWYDVYIYIYIILKMDGSMSDSKIVNLSLGETKKDGNLLSFLLHSAAPKKNKAAETKKKRNSPTPPHLWSFYPSTKPTFHLLQPRIPFDFHN